MGGGGGVLLQALGVDPSVGRYGTLRLSVGFGTTEGDVREGLARVVECVE